MTESTITGLRDRRILVLGGSGVIGSRLVELLVTAVGAEVSVVVRNLARAVRIARHPVDLIRGEVTDPDLLERAMAGKDVVIDLTFPKEGDLGERCENARVMARTIGAAVLKQGIRRLVHLSTISVYGRPHGAILDERSPRAPGKDPYGASKLAGEEEMLRLQREQGVPVVILQPTIVYGPFTGWSAGPISQLSNGTFVLPGQGRGACNAVYLDDVVQAILLAAVAEGVEGEVFLISGDPAVTWREFYGAYEAMLGFTSTRSMTEAEIRAALVTRVRAAQPVNRLLATLKRDPELRQMVLGLPLIAQCYGAMKTLTSKQKMEKFKDRMLDRRQTPERPAKPLIFPTTVQLGIYVPETVVSVVKAREGLGYSPRHNLQQGMARTRAWAEWARLL